MKYVYLWIENKAGLLEGKWAFTNNNTVLVNVNELIEKAVDGGYQYIIDTNQNYTLKDIKNNNYILTTGSDLLENY